MLDFDTALPFRLYKGFRFILADGPYFILYFSENSDFLVDKPRLTFRQLDFRNISLPNTDMPRTHLTGEVIQEYRDNMLIVNTPNRNPTNKNLIIDSTVYINEIDRKYSPKTYQNRYGDMIYKYILRLFKTAPEKSRKIFFYSVDLKTFKTTYQKTKFFIFLQSIKNGNIFFDDLILCVMSKNKVVYRILIKDKKIDYEKILYYIRNIRKG
jgi:hypothetical protein